MKTDHWLAIGIAIILAITAVAIGLHRLYDLGKSHGYLDAFSDLQSKGAIAVEKRAFDLNEAEHYRIIGKIKAIQKREEKEEP